MLLYSVFSQERKALANCNLFLMRTYKVVLNIALIRLDAFLAINPAIHNRTNFQKVSAI
jgi:hypothetical protein